jgi:hypothetical protein
VKSLRANWQRTCPSTVFTSLAQLADRERYRDSLKPPVRWYNSKAIRMIAGAVRAQMLPKRWIGGSPLCRCHFATKFPFG